MNMVKLLRNPINWARALSKALPRARLFNFPISSTLIFWIILLNAISHPYSFTYFMPSMV